MIRWMPAKAQIAPMVVLGVGLAAATTWVAIRTVTTSAGAAGATPTRINVVVHEGGAADVQDRRPQGWWDVEYRGGTAADLVRASNELHLPAGRPAVLEIVATGTVHAFRVPGLLARIDLLPGVARLFDIEPAEPGTYHWECAEEGGLQHDHARLVVTVDSPQTYNAWLETQRRDAAHAASVLTSRGADVFGERQCASCHAVRGTGARGEHGPDLTHVASRESWAADAPVSPADSLAGWVAHVRAAKSAGPPPVLRPLASSDQLALVAYLQSLR
jgi:cytochrome c oxidase subunit 2